MTEPKVNGSQFLYNDLSRRLIRLILESAPDTDPMVDVELRLVALIRERECLAARVAELESNQIDLNDMIERRDKAIAKLAARVEELEGALAIYTNQAGELIAENKRLRGALKYAVEADEHIFGAVQEKARAALEEKP